MKIKNASVPIAASLLTLAALLPALPAAAQSQMAEVNYKLGYYSVLQGKYDEAVKSLTEAIAAYPKYAEAYHYRGAAYRGLKQYDKAISDLNEAIRLKPDLADAYRERGVAHGLSVGSIGGGSGAKYPKMVAAVEAFDKANADLEKYLQLAPNAPDAAKIRPILDNQKKMSEDLRQKLPGIKEAEAKINSLNAERDKAWGNMSPHMRAFYEGNEAFKKKDYSAGITAFTEAIRVKPDFAAGYFARGLGYAATKQYDKMVPDLEKFLQLYPDAPSAPQARELLANAKSLKPAPKPDAPFTKADVDDFVKQNPNVTGDKEQATKDAEAAFKRGNDFARAKEFEKALTEYTEAIRLKATPAVYVNRGNVYSQMKQFDKAILDYNAALRINPTVSSALYRRGFAYAQQSENAKAIADYTEAIRLKPDYAEVYANRGQVYGRTKEYAKAIPDFEKFLQLQPDSPNATQVKALLEICKQKLSNP